MRRSAKSNEELESPRIIGNTIQAANQLSGNESDCQSEIIQNVFALMFGQVLAHDMGNLAQNSIKGRLPYFILFSIE